MNTQDEVLRKGRDFNWRAVRQRRWQVQFSSVAQLCPALCGPMDCSMQASLSITNSRSLPKLMSIKLVMPSNHLILCQNNHFMVSGCQVLL